MSIRRFCVERRFCRTLVVILVLLSVTLAGGRSVAGPVILAGHDADGHPGVEAVYAGMFDALLDDVTNGGSGILAIGPNPLGEAAVWIEAVAALMTVPQTVTLVNGNDIFNVDFSTFAILHVPSDSLDTAGGIQPGENQILTSRSQDVADFVNAGGGLFGLTQGEFTDAWGYLGVFAAVTTVDIDPSGVCNDPELFDNITATVAGNALGITNTNVDGCCWHNVFTSFAGFLQVLAVANEPDCPMIDGEATMLGGIITIPGQISLAPADDYNLLGEQHTLTATVIDGFPPNDPLEGVVVTFEVTAGPNVGDTGMDTTDVNGMATFTYTGDGGSGLDEIVASFVDPDTMKTVFSNTALKFWDEDCNANGIPDACDVDCAGLGGNCVIFAGCGGSADDNGDGIPDECLGFDPPDETLAAGSANIEAIADVNGDTFPDVVVALPDDEPTNIGRAQVFLNQGTTGEDWNGLTALPAFDVGRDPRSVALGLFDADEILDLAVANREDDTVEIFFGDGTGGFDLHATVIVGDRPSSLVAVDLDMDPVNPIDLLAVTNEGDNNVQILTNDGAGNFSTIPLVGGLFGVPAGPMSITTDDFDNNKCPDLVGSSSGAAAEGTDGSAWVLRGMPGGNFMAAETYAVGIDPRDIATGEFSGDLFTDVAVCNRGSDSVTLLINDGDGTFTATSLPVGAMPSSIDDGDLDGDGDIDLAVVADDAVLGPSVQILLNVGGGPLVAGASFDPPIAFGVDALPNFVVTADMDLNGLADLVTANTDTDGGTGGSVTTLLNSLGPAKTCAGDCAGQDGLVGIDDFLAVLGQWGGPGSCDFDGNGTVGIEDFLQILGAWGPCP